jgi:hypothetical protein
MANLPTEAICAMEDNYSLLPQVKWLTARSQYNAERRSMEINVIYRLNLTSRGSMHIPI